MWHKLFYLHIDISSDQIAYSSPTQTNKLQCWTRSDWILAANLDKTLWKLLQAHSVGQKCRRNAFDQPILCQPTMRNWGIGKIRGLGKARAQVLVVDPIDRFRLIQYGFASPRFSGPSQPIISPHCRPDCKELFVRLRTALNRFTQALANCRLISGPIPAWEVLSQTSSLDLEPQWGWNGDKCKDFQRKQEGYENEFKAKSNACSDAPRACGDRARKCEKRK